jgi:spermidine synthase
MSTRYAGEAPRILWVELDGDAGTQIIEHGVGRIGRDLPFLEADVTSTAHQLKRGALHSAFVIGGGGGRDVLAALHFGASRVRVAELNPAVVQAVDHDLRDFSGGPYSAPGVEVSVGEARSVLAREPRRFDLIQMSMIDTWASSMAGALVLNENGLYTAEAFALYLDRLQDGGMLSVSRWYHPERPGELARVVSLARAALLAVGARNPSDHVAIVYAHSSFALDVGTVVVKRTPFTATELQRLHDFTSEMGFFALWPRDPGLTDPVDLGAVLRGRERSSAFDLSPPTDDRPFFFNIDRPLASWLDALRSGDLKRGSRSTLITVTLLALLMLMSRLIILAPLARFEAHKPKPERTQLRDHLRAVTYFGGIGLGFMWVELAIIQRYITFLGQPTSALSVVLCTLLACGGVGSALSSRLGSRLAAAAIFVLVLVTAFLVPHWTNAAYAWQHPARIALAVALIAPLGLVMGMMYPCGVRLLERDGTAHLIPWVWAINGIAGVFASVSGMFVAMQWGYTAVLLLGAAAYACTGYAAGGRFSPTATRVK